MEIESCNMSSPMRLVGPRQQTLTSELKVLERMLPLAGAIVLELGCGAADKTRLIAERTNVASITAVEIDPVQHEKNLRTEDLPKVTFKSYGAQKIAEENNSFDAVIMFKSLHHVPQNDMEEALSEIRRVLKPGGYAYISEPVFAGEFNEIMRLFHNEEGVRQQAFDALKKAVENNVLHLEEEYFFKNSIRLPSFEIYLDNVLGVTHTKHELDVPTIAEVKRRFMQHESAEGFVFQIPNRVDLFRKIQS